MKLFIFRCRARRQLYGATRFETGSNLPTDRCAGGWEFEQFTDLAAPTSPRTGVDLRTLRRNIQDQGWHVWEDVRADSRQGAAPEPPPPPPEIKPPPPAVPPLLELEDAPDIPIVPPPPPAPPPPPPPVAREPARIAPPPPVAAPPPPPPPAATRTPAAESKATPRPSSHPPAERRRTASRDAAALAAARSTTAAAPPPAAAAPATPSARHQVVWFDIPVRDVDRALLFYSAVLGTPLSKAQAGPGVAMVVLPHTEGSIGGCLVQSLDARPADGGGPLLYLNTQGRLDEAVSAVEGHGGKVVHPRHSIEPFGFRAIVLDSEGNRIALHSM